MLIRSCDFKNTILSRILPQLSIDSLFLKICLLVENLFSNPVDCFLMTAHTLGTTNLQRSLEEEGGTTSIIAFIIP